MKCLVLYDSVGGNTEKAAQRIDAALRGEGLECDLIKVGPDTDLDFYDYELVFAGSPVYAWLPTEKFMGFIKKKLKEYQQSGEILPAAPLRPGRYAVPFCTYAGPHMGAREAVPMTKWVGAFFEHLGYLVLDELHVVGQFHGKPDMNTSGRLGDITGRPNEQDLLDVENRVKGLLRMLPQ